MFLLAAVATSLAAAVALVSPRSGILLDVVAVGLVIVDLRARILANGQAEKLREAIDSSREATVWEDIPGTPGAMDIKTRHGSFLGYGPELWSDPGFPASIVHPSDIERVDRVAGQGRARQNDFRVVFRAKGA